jgi:hypothetical protein
VGGKTKNPIVKASDSRPNQLGIAPAGGLNRDTHDPLLDFTAPADGEYILGVEDERGQGGADYVYRVEVLPDTNAVYTYIAAEPENQQVPQARQTVSVAAGNRVPAQIALFSTNRQYIGDLELVGVNLPPGVTLHAPKILTGQTKIPVVFEAAPGTKLQSALVDLVVRPVPSGDPLTSGFRQTIMMNGYGNNDYYLHTPVDKLALAVTETAPFHIKVEEPNRPLCRTAKWPSSSQSSVRRASMARSQFKWISNRSGSVPQPPSRFPQVRMKAFTSSVPRGTPRPADTNSP